MNCVQEAQVISIYFQIKNWKKAVSLLIPNKLYPTLRTFVLGITQFQMQPKFKLNS